MTLSNAGKSNILAFLQYIPAMGNKVNITVMKQLFLHSKIMLLRNGQ